MSGPAAEAIIIAWSSNSWGEAWEDRWLALWSGAGAGTAPAPNQIAALWELNRQLGAKIFFSSRPPDWLPVSRYCETRRASGVSRAKEFVRPEDVMAAGEKHRRGEVALRVLHSLPSQHEKFFYREIRKLCTDFVTSLGMPRADRASAAGELLSEVMAKLLGAGSSNNVDPDMMHASRMTQKSASDDQWPFDLPFQINIDAPEQDDRVRWLIKEVGGQRALKHRFEDMRRQRWGRWHGLGYRMSQISALTNGEPGIDRDEEIVTHQREHAHELQEDREDPHHDRDVRRAWIGMLALASCRFKPNEDVQKLLQVLGHDPEVQACFGIEWPVREIIKALNDMHPDPPWNDDRVENAKKRLRNWIGGIKRDHGLDQTDLMALFARYGRANAAVALNSVRQARPGSRPLRRGGMHHD